MVEIGRTPVPLIHPVALPPPLFLYEAAPKCISGRTSYHRTRLAFHSYPQVIQDFFNRHWFGPPPRFTEASTCPWIDRTASGLRYETISPSLRLGFPAATDLQALNLATYRNSPAHSSIGTPPSASWRTTIACKRTVSGLFTPRQGCFSPFPLGTASLSVTNGI